MRKTLYRVFFTMMVVWLFVAGGAYASTVNTYDVAGFNLNFGLTSEDYVYVDPAAGISTDVINTYGSFKFSSGFEKYSSVTFSPNKMLAGTGTETTQVGVLVSHISPTTYGRVTTFTSVQKVGQSGLYNLIVPLDHVGTNYVMVAVKQNGVTVNKQFKVVRKTEITKTQLETMELNFIESSSATSTTTEPAFNLLKSVFNFFGF